MFHTNESIDVVFNIINNLKHEWIITIIDDHWNYSVSLLVHRDSTVV